MKIREASFALRVVRRRGGLAGVLYRRRLTGKGEERLDRVAAVSPLAFVSAMPLLRKAVRSVAGREEGPPRPAFVPAGSAPGYCRKFSARWPNRREPRS